MKRYALLVCMTVMLAAYTTYAGPPISSGVATLASTVTVANEATDTTCFPLFGISATGALEPKTNAGLAFNSNTGMLTATGFSGPLNGIVGGTTPAAGTFTSVSVSRVASDAVSLTNAQFSQQYEDIDDGDHYRIYRQGNLTSTHVQLEPVGDPTAGQVKAYGVPAGGPPAISTGTWVTPALARTEKLATFSYSGGGSAIPADTKLDAYIPAASTITGWVMLSTTSCSMVVDIWSQAYADFPPEVGQTIIQSEPPTLTTAYMGQDLSLAATWTEALAAGVTLRANVTSSDCIGNVSVTLIGTIP